MDQHVMVRYVGKQKWINFLLLCISGILVAFQGEANMNREVRTYLAFSQTIDPAKIYYIPDMILSYALGGTLVEWSASKEKVSGLAEKMEKVDDRTFRFTLRKSLKWSDGSAVKSEQVRASFVRSLKDHPKDLRSLRQILERLSCSSVREIVFHLKAPVQSSNLLGKLTEPNYGVLRVRSEDKGEIDLSVSTGPFSLSSSSPNELVLLKNPHWHRANNEMPDRIIVRKAPEGVDIANVLISDPWPNLTETSSLASQTTLDHYGREGYSIWKRAIDKVYLGTPKGKLIDSSKRSLIHRLRNRMNRETLTDGLVGYELTEQIFPPGYELHDPSFNCPDLDPESRDYDEASKVPALDVVAASYGLPGRLRANLGRAISGALGSEPNFLDRSEIDKRFKTGDFDFYFGYVGLADPDPEGVMSFYFEGELPVVQSGTGRENYVERLDEARKVSDRSERLKVFRGILRDAVCDGRILPLFHLSTIGVGKPPLDLSKIPVTDEAVTFSEIRFR